MTKEYRLYQYYPSGNVVFRGCSTDLNYLQKKQSELETNNPSGMYQIH
jgi:hypothetical protein